MSSHQKEVAISIASLADFAASKLTESGKDLQSAWISVYRMAMARREHIPRPIYIELVDVIALVHWGKVAYFDGSGARFELDAGYQLKLDGAQFRNTESIEGAWLALVTPLQYAGAAADEATARYRNLTAVGLLSAIHNDNIAYSLLTENAFDYQTRNVHAFSPMWRSPHSLPPPQLDHLRIQGSQRAAAKISAGDLNYRNRIGLSLRWYRQSLETHGVDAILKTWVAIEALAMPSTDIAPVCERLGSIYGISTDEAKTQFMIGKFFGLRSRIVHDGAVPSIHAALMGFQQRVYVDLLLAALELPTRHEAAQFLRVNGADVVASMDRALVG